MWAVQIWNRNKQEYGRCVRSWNTGLRLRCTYLINLYLLKYISQFDHKRGHMCDFTPVSKWHVQHMNCHLCDRVDNHGSFYTVPSTFPQMLHAPSIGSLDRTSLELPSPLLRVQMVRIWVTSDKANAYRGRSAQLPQHQTVWGFPLDSDPSTSEELSAAEHATIGASVGSIEMAIMRPAVPWQWDDWQW